MSVHGAEARANKHASSWLGQMADEMAAGESSPPVRPAEDESWRPDRWEQDAPALGTWLNRVIGSTPSRRAKLERELEAKIRHGSGFADRDVLEFAYLSFREDLERPADFGPIVTPFDLDDDGTCDVPAPSPALQLLGVAEVCSLLGLRRMQLKRLRDAGKFPEPVAELAAGPIWRKDDLP